MVLLKLDSISYFVKLREKIIILKLNLKIRRQIEINICIVKSIILDTFYKVIFFDNFVMSWR
jgi:hypothetical protein